MAAGYFDVGGFAINPGAGFNIVSVPVWAPPFEGSSIPIMTDPAIVWSSVDQGHLGIAEECAGLVLNRQTGLTPEGNRFFKLDAVQATAGGSLSGAPHIGLIAGRDGRGRYLLARHHVEIRNDGEFGDLSVIQRSAVRLDRAGLGYEPYTELAITGGVGVFLRLASGLGRDWSGDLLDLSGGTSVHGKATDVLAAIGSKCAIDDLRSGGREVSLSWRFKYSFFDGAAAIRGSLLFDPISGRLLLPDLPQAIGALSLRLGDKEDVPLLLWNDPVVKETSPKFTAAIRLTENQLHGGLLLLEANHRSKEGSLPPIMAAALEMMKPAWERLLALKGDKGSGKPD